MTAGSVGERSARHLIRIDIFSSCDSEHESTVKAPIAEGSTIGGDIDLNKSVRFNLELNAGGGYSLCAFTRGRWKVGRRLGAEKSTDGNGIGENGLGTTGGGFA